MGRVTAVRRGAARSARREQRLWPGGAKVRFRLVAGSRPFVDARAKLFKRVEKEGLRPVACRHVCAP